MVPPTVAPAATRAHPHDHLVGLYDSDEFLADAVARFLAPAWTVDGIALVMATPDHQRCFADALAAAGVDPDDARYVAVDARVAIDAVTVDGRPDEDRFSAFVGALLDQHAPDGRPVYAFGELVALLWSDADVAGALELEELWNRLATRRAFSLFCGYPTAAFERDQDTDAFRRVCDAHSAVLPSERFALLPSRDDEHLAVALLQQESVAGANERDALRAREAMLQAQLDAGAEATRLQRQFTAMLVHDLRSPTTIVTAVLRLLQHGWSDLDDDEVLEQLDTAARSAEQMRRLIDDLLVMARLESGQFRFDLAPVDLTALVEEVADETRKACGRAIEVSVPATAPPVLADSGRQLQILTNLLSNAVKFSPPDAPVHVEARHVADHLVVEVRDAGPGIAASDLPALFRPFSRPVRRPNQAKGTGLGLFITRSLVEGQGGRIEVRSEVGVGSTFTYSVPVVPEAR